MEETEMKLRVDSVASNSESENTSEEEEENEEEEEEEEDEEEENTTSNSSYNLDDFEMVKTVGKSRFQLNSDSCLWFYGHSSFSTVNWLEMQY